MADEPGSGSRIGRERAPRIPEQSQDGSEFEACERRRMSTQRPQLDQVFILRFWRESADASEDARWRVLVRNINSRRRDVVDDVQGAFAIVTSNLNAAVGEHDGPDRLDAAPSKND